MCPAVVRQLCVVSILIAAVHVVPAHAQSEAVVRGEVVAAADGSPVSRAAVTLASTTNGESMQAHADAAGHFAFQNVRPGEYLLSVASEGFQKRDLALRVQPREVRTATVVLDLQPLAISLNVVADPSPLPITHSPSSTVLTSARLESAPIFQRINLPDAVVTAAPGMIRGHDDFVHIRGHEIALNPLINGVSFWENTHAVFSAGLSADVIETASVMTGGFPPEYGNRFGGVVDIVTKSGFTMDNSGVFTASGGEAGRRRLQGEYGGHRGGLGYYVFASLFESDRFLSPPEPEAIHDGARGAHVFLQVDRNLNRAGSLRAVVIGDGTNFEIPKTQLDVELRPQANADQRARQQTATLAWTRAWPRVAVAASFYERWSRTRLTPAAGPLTAQARLDRSLWTIGTKADVTRLAGRHAVKAGFDAVRLSPREDLSYNYAGYRDLTHLLELPHIHITGQAIAFNGDDSGAQVSGYVQDTIQVGSRLTANVGVRIDRHDLVVLETHVSPRVNLALEVAAGTVLHASYNNFFVPPPIEGVLSSRAGLTRFIGEIAAALPPLEPTKENQVEVGLSTRVRPLQLGATGYYRATGNPVHTTVWPDSRIYSYASFDRARAYGLELKAEAPGLARYGVTGYLNYALGRVNFYNPVTGGFVTEAAHVSDTNRFLAPMDQTHTATGGLTYRDARSGLSIGATMEYGSGTPIGHGSAGHEHAEEEADHAHAAASAPDRVPDHFTANLFLGVDLLRGGARRPRLSFQIDVENISNRVYLIAQDSEFSPSQFSIPRIISVTARIRF